MKLPHLHLKFCKAEKIEEIQRKTPIGTKDAKRFCVT